MSLGIGINPVSSSGKVKAAPVAVVKAPAPVLLAPVVAAPASSSIAFDWRFIFGASAVRFILSMWPNVRLSSWVRSPARNAAVGGVSNSFHLVGLGADFVVPAAERAAFKSWLRERWPVAVDIVDEGDHVHVEWTRWDVTPLSDLLVASAAAIVAVLVAARLSAR